MSHTRQVDYLCQRCHSDFDRGQAIHRQGYHHCPECGSDKLAENVTVPVRYLQTGRYRIAKKTMEIAA